MSSAKNRWLMDEHKRRNSITLGAVEVFAKHRERMTQLFLAAARTVNVEVAPRGAVLGAGNCNDLDLPELLEVFGCLLLVDIDREATEAAVGRQLNETMRSRVEVAPSTDVTGIFAHLQLQLGALNSAPLPATLNPATLDLSQLEAILAEKPIQLPGAPFDCVLSSCLLSQLIDSLKLALGLHHPSLNDLIFALRRQHLRSLVHSLVPGGCGLLITYFVSSQSLPNLMQIADSHLQTTLLEAIVANNFFTGLNPFAIQAELQNSVEFSSQVSDVKLLPPWRWDMGFKQFAVAAIAFKRK